MTLHRWTQSPGIVSPAAHKHACELETRGYTQHEPKDLDDNEGVVVLDGGSGANAPARYHRRGKPGDNGHRPDNVFEAYPDSPWADPLPYADSMVNTGGTSMSRLGIFRLNAPEHFDDVAELYNGRARRHRDEAAAMQPIPTHETNPMS